MSNTKAQTNKDQNRLLKRFSLMGSNELSDEYFAIAYNIEDALLYSGAEPGKDYTRLDLFHLAQPFVLEKFKGVKMEYTYPADRVAD